MLLSTLKQYLRWKLKPETYVILSKPLNIRIQSKKPDPKYLTISEIDKLHKNCKDNRERFIISVLFGSGQRAEEFLNNRFSDYVLPEKKENFVKLTIRHGYSKTEGRTISLYYERCLESVRDYLNEIKGIEPDEVVIKDSYDSIRHWLARLGLRVLNKPLNFHLFRSSCASWLANRLNRQQLCYYFAWKFNSSMPDTYINRKGLIMDDVDDKFEKTELEELKDKLEKQNAGQSLEIDQLKEMNRISYLIEYLKYKKPKDLKERLERLNKKRAGFFQQLNFQLVE